MTINCQDRCGTVTVEVLQQALPTPRLALYTKSGAIPYLNFNFVRKNEGIIYRDSKNHSINHELLKVNVSDLLDLNKDNALEQLVNLPYFEHYAFMLTLYDPLVTAYQDLKSTTDSTPVLTLHGKKMITVEQMCNISHKSGAAYMQSLADINTPPIAKKKWTAKAVNRSNNFLEETLSRSTSKEEFATGGEENKRIKLNGDGNQRSSGVWATVSGGFSVKDRVDSCRAVSLHADKLAGVVIDSFFGYHQQARTLDTPAGEDAKTVCLTDSYTDIAGLLQEHILPNLPTHLPRALWGVFYPDDMLRLVQGGIDILDSSICTLLTQNGLALPSPLIDLQSVRLRFSRFAAPPDSGSVEDKGTEDKTASVSSSIDPSPNYVINLNEDVHTRVTDAVLSEPCACYTCTGGYSRAYINHLLRRKELNGSMLLAMHNHFALTQFFAHIRHLIEHKQFHQLLVNSQLMDQHNDNATTTSNTAPSSQ